MRLRGRHLLLNLFLATALSAAGCANVAYLEIELTGTGLPEIHRFFLNMTVTDANRAVTTGSGFMPEDPTIAPITLPTTAALEFDDGETGTFTIEVSALDILGERVATAVQSTMIKPKETWRIVMNLQPITTANAVDDVAAPAP